MSRRMVLRSASLALAACVLLSCIPTVPTAGSGPRDDPYPGAFEITNDTANITGTLSGSSDVDVYKLLLNRTAGTVERVQAHVRKTSTGGEVRVNLQDALGFRLAMNGTLDTGEALVSAGAPFTGYVYILLFLWPGTPSADYELNVTKANLTDASLLMDDNNVPLEAFSAGDGYQRADGLDADFDVADFYSVDLDARAGSRQVLNVLLAVPPQADLMVELVSANDTSNPVSTDKGDLYHPNYGVNESLYYVPPSSGPFLVRIWTEHGGGNYSVGFRVFRGYADTDNDQDNGTVMAGDGVHYGNVSLYVDDLDYYRIFLPAETTLDLCLTVADFDDTHGLPLISLWLFDPARSLVNSSTSALAQKRVGALTTFEGWYYIKMAAGKESAGSYTLAVSTIRPPEVLVPESEVAFDEDTNGSLDLTGVFRDQSGRPLNMSFASPEHLNVTLDGMLLTMVPAPDWNGHLQFTVTARNQDQKSASALVSVGVRPVNDRPEALQSDLSFSTLENEAFVLPMSVFAMFNDQDGEALAYSVAGASNISVSIDDNGTVTLSPSSYWWGNETLRLVATDQSGESASVRITINVIAVNYPPQVASEPGEMSFPEDSYATVDLARLFLDPDGQMLDFCVTGAIYLNATILGGMATVRTASSFWPAGWDGKEPLTFTATDPFNLSARLTINFTVLPVDEPPYVFRPLPNQSMLEDLNLTLFNLNGYFRDQHGDPLNFAVVGAANVTARISPDGNVSLAPAPNWTGHASMTFTATDQFGGRAQLQFNLTVEPVNDAPVLTEAMVSPSKGDPSTVFTFSVVCRDIDSANVTVRLFIGRRSLPMERVQGDLRAGALFRVQTTLPEGASSYYFESDDTDKVTDTGLFEAKVSSAPVDNTWLYILLGVAIIVMLALALAFTPPRKHRWEETDEEE